MGLFRRKHRDMPVDMNERSPQLGLRYKDLAVLGQLSEQGADLNEPRHVIYYCYATSEAIAQAMARDAEQKGFTTAVKAPIPEARGLWSVVSEITAATTPDFVRGSDDFFQDLADRNDAEYDGWEASVCRGISVINRGVSAMASAHQPSLRSRRSRASTKECRLDQSRRDRGELLRRLDIRRLRDRPEPAP